MQQVPQQNQNNTQPNANNQPVRQVQPAPNQTNVPAAVNQQNQVPLQPAQQQFVQQQNPQPEEQPDPNNNTLPAEFNSEVRNTLVKENLKYLAGIFALSILIYLITRVIL